MVKCPDCFDCNKPLYPIFLDMIDRKKWCECDEPKVSFSWSGFIDRVEKKYKGKKRR